METLYRELAEDIKTLEQYNQSMDSASWGYEEGILLTGNQAKEILHQIEKLEADKAELLKALDKSNKHLSILHDLIDNIHNNYCGLKDPIGDLINNALDKISNKL